MRSASRPGRKTMAKRPVVRGVEEDDLELADWIKHGKKLLTKSKFKRYGE